MKSATVDPRELFARLREELPAHVVDHVIVVGSLAAAYHHADRMSDRGVRTKDADLVIHPAGHIVAAQEIAACLLGSGWREKPGDLAPGTADTPADQRPAIRLFPPEHDDSFRIPPPPGGSRTPGWAST